MTVCFTDTSSPLLAGGLAVATESFEQAPIGSVGTLETEYGTLKAEPGNAAVQGKPTRTDK